MTHVFDDPLLFIVPRFDVVYGVALGKVLQDAERFVVPGDTEALAVEKNNYLSGAHFAYGDA